MIMIHRLSGGFLAALMLFCIVLAGCEQEQAAPVKERVVTDPTGREVKMPEEVKSIAVVPIPWASVAFAVDGSADRIAGMHPSAKASYEKSMLKVLAPGMANAATDFVGQDFSIHMEELGKLHDPPLTKDAVAGRIRRLLATADKAAEAAGIPNTEASLPADLGEAQ